VILACLGALMLLVTFTPLVRWWAIQLASPWEDARGETLIVLSGSGASEGFIGYGTYLRSEYAVRVWREGGFQKVLVSGGGSGEPQATVMRQFLIAEGVPDTAIVVEPRANSTRENAVYTRELLEGSRGRMVLLTSDYHVYRAARVFRKAGLNVSPRPVPDVLKRASLWSNRWPAFLDLSVETVKIVYYRVRGWI
jgi:uncharacterized SAM-binding protein YcdF (DUF218 family)